MFTAADVVVAPALSVAVAVSAYAPGASPPSVVPKGELVAVPTKLPFAKKSTLLMLPSGSLALAVTGTLAGAVKVAPSGLGDRNHRRRIHDGGTVMFTAPEVAVAPSLSVAVVVSAYWPGLSAGSVVLKGELVAVPTRLPLEKNSASTTLPSGSLAWASIVTEEVEVNVAPLAGPTIVTVGG